MLLYTIVPPEEIFAEEEEAPDYLYLETPRGQVQVERTGPREGRIVRLLGTDPFLYLDPRWQPGVTIYW